MVVEWIIAGGVLLGGIALLGMYRIVPPSQAHFVTSPGKTFVVSADSTISNKRWYFAIPILRNIRKMDLTIKELVLEQETIEKSQARYNVNSSVKYRVKDVKIAAETISDLGSLQEQLKEVVLGGTRAVTVKYDLQEARADKRKIDSEIRNEIQDDFAKWGLDLVNFQLTDFQDTQDSNIVSDISKRREIEIATRTREENAEKIKAARIKEADATEKAQTREIEKDKVIGEKEQNKTQAIAEQAKIAEEKRFEVVRVQQIKQAEIDKDKAIVEAEQEKATESIMKEKKQLEGEGDRLKQEEQAKGAAAPIREKGLAEAEALDAKQLALNKFKDEAIRALTAELIVEKDKAIGVATAEAFKDADIKAFVGGESSKQGFDLASLLEAAKHSSPGVAEAIENRMARPNDLGLSELDLDKFKKDKKKEEPKPTNSNKERTNEKEKRNDRNYRR